MEARNVPASNGWQWIKQSWNLFRQNPVLWVFLVLSGISGLILLSYIPVVGPMLPVLLFPVLMGGLAAGCQAQDAGKELELGYLIAGLRKNTQWLVALGGLNLVCQMLILQIISLAGGAPFVDLMTNSQETNPEAAAAAMQLAIDSSTRGSLMIGGALTCLLLLAMQFAPVLVMLSDARPFAAMKASLRGCLRNVGAMFIYSIALIPFAFIASMPMFLGWLVLLPVVMISMYAGYKDLFAGAPAA
ncbi:MAG: hypothetical protein LBE50_07090 [Gallionellaceae bacterium]|jgi:uncharacterized membrane protein|nr:hypothetical protein [Gallionellaceae bacterium]